VADEEEAAPPPREEDPDDDDEALPPPLPLPKKDVISPSPDMGCKVRGAGEGRVSVIDMATLELPWCSKTVGISLESEDYSSFLPRRSSPSPPLTFKFSKGSKVSKAPILSPQRASKGLEASLTLIGQRVSGPFFEEFELNSLTFKYLSRVCLALLKFVRKGLPYSLKLVVRPYTKHWLDP